MSGLTWLQNAFRPDRDMTPVCLLNVVKELVDSCAAKASSSAVATGSGVAPDHVT